MVTRELPTGTVTFLFTDVEGSTQLLQRLDEAYPAVLEKHARLIREALEPTGGVEVSTEGDAFFCVFPSAPQAVGAAATMQRALASNAWPEGIDVRVRMGLHSGEGVLGGDNYVGIDVHRAARIASAGHGGQVLVSDTTRKLSEHALPVGTSLRDLGPHSLKDLGHPEQLHELVIDGLEADFPPLRTLDPVLHNLPTQLTSFIGRDTELAEVTRALSRARLVTLTGPGGTGKTRLALEAAASADGRFPDGTWFVGLAAITDPSLLATAIVEALGLRYSAGSARDQVAQHFAQRDALLVLDNFEQLLPAAPEVAELLRECVQLHVLVTSRAPLRISGEQEVPVPPLAAPVSGSPMSSSEVVARYPAVHLFVERALSARPDFTLTDEDAATVAEIAARLDGLPLAIELAAALVKLLPPRAIAERLGHRLDLLTGGPQDLPQRQRSLRDAIAWSYELLEGSAARLLERMAVFVGGASLEMIEKVCEAGDSSTLFEGIRTLVDQSLLVQSEEGGEVRFVMFGAIREFALERLEARGEIDEVRRRHADAFRALAADANAGVRGPEEARWAAVVGREFDNIRGAVTWGIDQLDHDLVLSIAMSLFRYALFRLRDEVFRWCEAALELPDAQTHPLVTPAHGVVGWGHALRDERRLAVDVAERGLARSPDPDDPARLYPLEVLATMALFEGRMEESLGFIQEAKRLMVDPWERGYAYVDESLACTYGGNADGGLEVAMRFRREAERLRCPTLLAWAAYTQGEALREREPDRALALFEEAMALADSVGSRFIIGVAQVSASSLEARHGDAAEALGSFRELIEQWHRAGTWAQLWVTLRTVADAYVRLGSFEAAAVVHEAVMDADRGGTVFGEDAERLGVIARTLEDQLEPDTLARARARGRSLSDDEVVGFVLAEIDRLLRAR